MPKIEYFVNSDLEIKKKKIIEACLIIVDKYGIKGATTARIAKEVGVVESALYRHFPSKKEIFLQILKETYKIFESIIEEVEKMETDPLNKLTIILEKQLDFLKLYPGLIRIVYSDEIYKRDEEFLSKLNNFLNSLIERIEKIIREGVKKKVVKPDIDLPIAALNFLGIIQISLSYWAIKNRKISPSLIGNNLLSFFFDGIKLDSI